MRREFLYIKPQNLGDLFAAMQEYPDYALLAGGTDLLVDMRNNVQRPSAVIDLKGISDLSEIRQEEERIFIGALATISALEQSTLILRHFPVFEEVIAGFACHEIRNRATLGGNIARASPCADFPPVLMVLEGTVRMLSLMGERESSVEEFFLGPRKTILKDREFIKGFYLPIKEGVKAVYLRVGRGRGMDLAGVNVAIARDGRQVRIALGAVAPTPVRARRTEKILESEISPESVPKALAESANEINPISDVRGSAWYRTEMVKSLLGEALARVLEFSGESSWRKP